MCNLLDRGFVIEILRGVTFGNGTGMARCTHIGVRFDESDARTFNRTP